MNVKKIIRKTIPIVMTTLLLTTLLPTEIANAITPSLTITPDSVNNSVNLNWYPPDTSQNYSYRLYSKGGNDSTYQSIPSKENIKVLNIYPDVGNNLKTWMETNGYGKGLISVDEVSISNFNNNPVNYLKDSNGLWKYDVIMFGSWDGNNSKDLSETAKTAVDSFVKTGRGVLFGHDTMLLSNFGYFKPYLNMSTNSVAWDNVGVGSNVKVAKKGLLTNYPWVIGDIGTNLTVPTSHSWNATNGDIWMRYVDTPGDYIAGVGDCDFYLTTWNNTAQIQTGHSNGLATPDEQMLIANTLFYLAQVTDDTVWVDHKGQDLTPPNPTSVTGISFNNNQFTINYTKSTDNGSTYSYYVEATGENNHVITKSEIKTTFLSSDIQGYAVLIDQNSTGTPNKDNLVTGTSYTFNNPYSKGIDFYAHVASVDGSGNMSAVTNYFVDNTAPNLTISASTNSWTNQNITLTATATDTSSEVKRIKLPDNNWVANSTATYVISENGTYTFFAEDVIPNQISKTITISNIDKTIPILDLTPNTTSWVNNNVTITATGSDSQSGVKRIKLPNDAYVNSSTATYIANSNGTYEFVVEDNVGNTYPKTININNIDKTSPTLKLSLDSDLITNKTVTINATASDSQSSIKSITKPDGTIVNSSNATYITNKNGNYSFIATDTVGNTSTVSITINNIISINTISGIDHIEYRFEGATACDWTNYNSLAIVNEGTTSVYARAVDKAGNYSDVATSVVKLDRSVPINNTIKIITN